jgi:hypothetical protein
MIAIFKAIRMTRSISQAMLWTGYKSGPKMRLFCNRQSGGGPSMADPQWLCDYPGARRALETLVRATHPSNDRERVRQGLLDLLEVIRTTDREARPARHPLHKRRREQRFNKQLATAHERLNEFLAAIAAVYLTPAIFFLPPVEPVLDALIHWKPALHGLETLFTGHQPLRDMLVARLVCDVEKRAGAPHGRQVSTLLTAALGTDWTRETLNVWRVRHKRLIQEVKEIQEARIRRATARYQEMKLQGLRDAGSVFSAGPSHSHKQF